MREGRGDPAPLLWEDGRCVIDHPSRKERQREALRLSRLSATLAVLPTPAPRLLPSLAAAFTHGPDPRRQASRTDPLAALLSLVVTALLADQTSLLAVAAWGRRHGRAVLAALGLPDGTAPCQSTLQRLVCRLDPAAVSAALSAPCAPSVAPDPTRRGAQGVAIDGQAQGGRVQAAPRRCPVHALTAFTHARPVVLAQEPIERGADTRAGERPGAPALLARLDWRGRVLPGDAQVWQRSVCQPGLTAGTETQPTPRRDIALLFDPPGAGRPPALDDRRVARTSETGPGRRAEVRHLVASTDLTG